MLVSSPLYTHNNKHKYNNPDELKFKKKIPFRGILYIMITRLKQVRCSLLVFHKLTLQALRTTQDYLLRQF